MAQFEPLLPEAGAHLWALRNQEKKDKDPEKQCDLLVVVIIKSLFQQQYFKKKLITQSTALRKTDAVTRYAAGRVTTPSRTLPWSLLGSSVEQLVMLWW